MLKKNNGFSLVELLVSIGLLTTFIVTIVPALSFIHAKQAEMTSQSLGTYLLRSALFDYSINGNEPSSTAELEGIKFQLRSQKEGELLKICIRPEKNAHRAERCAYAKKSP